MEGCWRQEIPRNLAGENTNFHFLMVASTTTNTSLFDNLWDHHAVKESQEVEQAVVEVEEPLHLEEEVVVIALLMMNSGLTTYQIQLSIKSQVVVKMVGDLFMLLYAEKRWLMLGWLDREGDDSTGVVKRVPVAMWVSNSHRDYSNTSWALNIVNICAGLRSLRPEKM